MWDRYRALMSAVMMQAIIDYKTYYKSPNPPQGYWSAVGHILNDENWQLLDISMTGEDAMKVINKKTLQEIKSSWGYADETIDCKPIIAINIKTGEVHHYSNIHNAFKFDEGGDDDGLVASIQTSKKRARKNA